MEFFNQYFLDIIKNRYVDFEGRTGRTEFWRYLAIYLIIHIALSILSRIPLIGLIFGIILILFFLATLLPTLGIGARRLHDVGKSGWLQFLLLIPGLGLVILALIAWAKEGTAGNNEYGPEPKDA